MYMYIYIYVCIYMYMYIYMYIIYYIIYLNTRANSQQKYIYAYFLHTCMHTLHCIPFHYIPLQYRHTCIHTRSMQLSTCIYIYTYAYKHSQCNKIPSVMMCGAGVIHRCFGWTGSRAFPGSVKFSARDDNEGCPLIVIKTT